MKRQSVTNEVKVQRQIKALQKRIKALEYDIIDIRMKIKPVNEIRHIGFIQHSNLHSDNDYNNE